MPSQLASRTADNLFWVGRYAERAEASARLLRSLFGGLNDLNAKTNYQDKLEWAALKTQLEALNKINLKTLGLSTRSLSKLQKELLAFCSSPEQSAGLQDNLSSLFGAAYAVKSAWSSDSWRVLDACQDLWKQGETLRWQQLSPKLNEFISLLMAFAGLNSESMSQGLGWRFLDMGRRIERARMIIKLIQAVLIPATEAAEEDVILEKLLSTTENIISYRRRYRRVLNVQHTLELILFDENNPRALGFQLRRLEEHQRLLPRTRGTYSLSAEEKLLIDVSSRLRLADSAQLSAVANAGKKRSALELLLDHLLAGLEHYAVVLTGHYFSHTQVAYQLNRQELTE